MLELPQQNPERTPPSFFSNSREAFAQLFELSRLGLIAVVFPVLIFALLALTKLIPMPNIFGFQIYRYDVILFACLLIQYLMWRTKLETLDELKVIGVFHVLGLLLEIFKTHMGSWAYPEVAYLKISNVPLYSGFMYASVASFMIQCWRLLHFRISLWHSRVVPWVLTLCIYINFFSHHVLPDARWILIGLVVYVFWYTRIHLQLRGVQYQMPLVLAFGLLGGLIWVAENIATYFNAWQYPSQKGAWHMVDSSKLSSWCLLVIVSFIVVAALKDTNARWNTRQTQNN
jgi:uncharacterized membrane protein YoaT (DUF817 family)